MNDQLLAAELAAVLAADSGLHTLIPTIVAEQQGAITARPSLTLSGEFEPYLAARKGALSIELRSRLGDEAAAASDADHHARFVALWTKLLGAQGATPAITLTNRAAAKAAIEVALLARHKVAMIDYGAAQTAVEASADGEDLITRLHLRVMWTFLV